MVFGNDERMNEARKLLSVEKTQDVVCVFQPNVKVIKEDTKRIPWGARAYAFDFDEDARRILAEKSVKMIKYGDVEEFKKENSVLTAEGVLIILLEKSKTKISDKRVLVVGNGASGKEIVDILLRLNVKVSVMTSHADSVKKRRKRASVRRKYRRIRFYREHRAGADHRRSTSDKNETRRRNRRYRVAAVRL